MPHCIILWKTVNTFIVETQGPKINFPLIFRLDCIFKTKGYTFSSLIHSLNVMKTSYSLKEANLTQIKNSLKQNFRIVFLFYISQETIEAT